MCMEQSVGFHILKKRMKGKKVYVLEDRRRDQNVCEKMRC